VGNKQVNVAMITKEWPPQIYGGAGVHVKNLVSALIKLPQISTQVYCFGPTRPDALAFQLTNQLSSLNPALQTLLIGNDIANQLSNFQVVHSHTWYANFAGFLAKQIYGTPHIATAHSLEPLRPWKAEQLGGGYQISSWVERCALETADAIIAVSDGMRKDVLNSYKQIAPEKVYTIRNGIDTNKFQPNHDKSVLTKYQVTSPYAMFVGRITRQKGLAHLLRAWNDVAPEYTLVMAASSPDELQIGQEVESLVADLQSKNRKVIWIKQMLPHEELTALLTGAQVFLCPSIYEPLGIVNLEAMACETAVIGSRVGGIPEVVTEGETGVLVDYISEGSKFSDDLAAAINHVMSDTELAKQMGDAGRKRAISEFGWDKVALQTAELYRSVIK
jgi:starch synthase